MSAFPILTAGLAAALLLAASPALAQSYNDDDDDYRPPVTQSYAGDDDDDDDYRPPLAGADISHDYLRNYYYDYEGTAPRDPRVGEQEGWRDGVLHTPPRSWWNHCGCGNRGYWHGRWYTRPQLYDYGERTFDRAQLDRRTPYEYRWPHRNW